MSTRDLVIIGGGAGGLVVASVAAQLGLAVTLVERAQRLGGDCLHHGCVPSKALIRTAEVASLMRRAADFGLPSVAPQVDMARVSAHVRAVIEEIQHHDDPERFRGYGCEVLLGEPAEFLSPREVRVGDRRIRARRFVLATGSGPFVPPIEGLREAGFLTNLDVFSLRTLPRRLVVLGAGPIGLELGQAFARLGSKVTVIERLPRPLPHEDPEITDALMVQLAAEGIEVHAGIEAQRVRRSGETTIVECSGGLALTADALLVAVGRSPNVAGLGLDAAGVRYGARGIEVDRRMRTSQHHIYACGDVCGPYAFTHMAEYQAGIVIANAVFRFPKRADYRVVPRVTFTDPELAHVGMTEAQARERGIAPDVLRFPFRDIDRAITERECAGLVKLVAHRGRLLGASVLGPRGGELLHELALAMTAGVRLSVISATIHAYPTLAQVHRRAVNAGLGKRLFSRGTRRLVRMIHRLLP